MADDPTAKRSSGEENDRVKYGASCMQGGRDEMQDAHNTILELDGSEFTSYFGVYDGHGGKTIAWYCSEQLHIELVKDPDYVNNLPTAMRNVYLRKANAVMADDPTAKRSSREEKDRIKYGASCMQGGRDEMQDATAILELDASDFTSFFGVYDGHGGQKLALYCSEQLLIELVKDPDYVNNLPTAMRNVYFRIDDALRRTYKGLKSESRGMGKLLRCLCSSCRKKEPFFWAQRKVREGTTACVALIRGNQITVGNAGDSRCVLSRSGQAIDLSTDHKPENAGIESAGLQVIEHEVGRMRNGRLVIAKGLPRIDGKIAVSRPLGDFEYKQNKKKSPEQQKMTCNPDIYTEKLTDDADFLLIASDGIWHERLTEEVVGFVNHQLRSVRPAAAQIPAREAPKPQHKKSPSSSRRPHSLQFFTFLVLLLLVLSFAGKTVAVEAHGGWCDARSLSSKFAQECDVFQESQSQVCCDTIFAVLGRDGCLCKVVEEPEFRSSGMAGANIIVQMYYTPCNGGPHVSPKAEQECNSVGSPPPSPPPPPPPTPTPPSAHKEDSAAQHQLTWKIIVLLVGGGGCLLGLVCCGVWALGKRMIRKWYAQGRGYRLGGEVHRWSGWCIKLKDRADRVKQLLHEGRGWLQRMTRRGEAVGLQIPMHVFTPAVPLVSPTATQQGCVSPLFDPRQTEEVCAAPEAQPDGDLLARRLAEAWDKLQEEQEHSPASPDRIIEETEKETGGDENVPGTPLRKRGRKL